jgi:SAM-dependent methyltransferase
MDLKELPTQAFVRHPWEIVRAEFFLRLLRERVKGEALAALDIGSGDGYCAERLLAGIPRMARITCFDLAYDADWLKGPVTRDSRLLFTATKPTGNYDLVLMLDVLEHVENDETALNEAASTFLKPGGSLLLSVPAGQMLFSRHDELLGHKRRYSPARLRALTAKAGLDVLDHGQLFASLLLPRALAKLSEVTRGEKRPPINCAPARIETSLGTWHRGPLITSAVTTALSLDAACCRLASHLHLPFWGLSTWLLAQKP